MKDLHSHLLYRIDDGSRSIEESIFLLKRMENSGVKELILTPHYVENSKFNCNNYNKEIIFNKLSEKAKEENISIKLYLGNEAYITDNLVDLIEKGEIRTLNNSKYLLFEFPLRQKVNGSFDIIHKIITNGYIPVLAHPERYITFQEHPELIAEYLRAGVLLQGNFTSLFNKYGKKSQKTLKYFLKNKMITFLGSDTHRIVEFDEKKLRKKLLRITKDKEYVEDLLNNNFDKVINNQDIGIVG